MSISVLLADDQPLLPRGFRMILEADATLGTVKDTKNDCFFCLT